MEELLEREEELANLAAAAPSARDGRGAVVLLRREAGIAKTSLPGALRDRARWPFHRVWSPEDMGELAPHRQ